MKNEAQVAEALMRLRNRAPEETALLVKAISDAVGHTAAELVMSPPENLQRNQGRALMMNEVSKVFQQAEEIYVRTKARTP